VIYVPHANFVGVDTFKYVIAKNGSLALYDTTTVIVYSCQAPHVIAVDDCSDTTGYVDQLSIINVLGNDTLYPATDTIVTVVFQPGHGVASVNADFTITFVPDSGWYGHDSMMYRVCEVVGKDTACSSALVCINVIDSVIPCYFPNGFSPNNDGYNDVFAFPCNTKYPNASLQVFNRWGDLVWESGNGYKNDWGGTNLQGKPVPDGTYYFIYRYNDGTNREQARFVVVNR
jgi:gliding motility-associated-like protein